MACRQLVSSYDRNKVPATVGRDWYIYLLFVHSPGALYPLLACSMHQQQFIYKYIQYIEYMHWVWCAYQMQLGMPWMLLSLLGSTGHRSVVMGIHVAAWCYTLLPACYYMYTAHSIYILYSTPSRCICILGIGRSGGSDPDITGTQSTYIDGLLLLNLLGVCV